MSDEPLQPSDPDELEFTTELVTLRGARTKSKAPFVVSIRMLSGPEVMIAMDGYPDMPATASAVAARGRQMADQLSTYDELARKLADAACVSPRFSFSAEREAGKAPWSALTLDDRITLVRAILKLAGWEVPDGTQAVRTFPVEQGGGGSAGAPAGEAQHDGEAAVAGDGAGGEAEADAAAGAPV